MAVLVIIGVVLFITVSLQMTVIIVFVVILVNVYMTAVTQFWGLTINYILAVNISFSLGVALDYSSHIGHSYLSVKTPASIRSDRARREFKAKKAISQMGSSVFHGGFSTLICILVLSAAKLYSIQVFYKSWVCIISFGMLNGLVLLPVILSLVGPLEHQEDPLP